MKTFFLDIFSGEGTLNNVFCNSFDIFTFYLTLITSTVHVFFERFIVLNILFDYTKYVLYIVLIEL